VKLLRGAILALFVSIPSIGSCQWFPIREFGGLNSDDSTLLLQSKQQSPDSQNVVTDNPSSGVEGRMGFVSVSTFSTADIWDFPHSNGTRYRIIRHGNTLMADRGNGTFNITVSTVTSGVVVVGTVLGDFFYFSDLSVGLKRWNGTTTTIVDASKKFITMVTHVGRIWGAGVPNTERTIYVSAFNDGTDWTVPSSPVDDDPVQFVVGGALDENLSVLHASFLGRVMWFKNTSFGGVLGVDRSDFEVRTYSDKTGTAYKDSIQDCAGFLRFLGPLRTVWEFNGTDLVKISEDIDNLIGTAIQGDARGRTFVYATQTDFNTGSSYRTSNSISPSDVVLSSWTGTDTSSTNFSGGTASSMDFTTTPGNLELQQNNTNVTNNSFESSESGNWTLADGAARSLLVAKSGSYSVVLAQPSTSECSSGFSFYATLYGVSPSVQLSQNSVSCASLSDDTWYQMTLNTSAGDGKNVYVVISFDDGYAQSIPFYGSGESLTVWFYKLPVAGPGGSGSTSYYVFADLVEGGRSSIVSGNFTSRTFDTNLSSPTWNVGSVSANGLVTNGNSITWGTQSSNDGSSWETEAGWTVPSAPTSGKKRYFRYKVYMSTAISSSGIPYITDVTFSADETYGGWVGPAISLGSISGFGLYSADAELDGATNTYAIYTDTNTSMTITNGVPVVGTFISSQSVTNGSIPTISTRAYARLGFRFNTTDHTQDPELHSISLAWTEGSLLRVASGFPNQRYWLSVAISSAANNTVLVYDKRRQWQKYVGINANAMAVYSGSQFFGNTTGLYQAEVGYNDNSASITAYSKAPSDIIFVIRASGAPLTRATA